MPEPVPPLIRNASLASIMRDRSCAAPGVSEPEATQSSSEKLRCAGTRSEMQVPGDAKLPSTACTRLPFGQPRVDEGHRIVEAPTDRGCQPLGEPAYVAFARESKIRQLEAGTTIDEHLIRAVDQNIGHPRLMKQRLQWAGAHAVPSQRLHGVEHSRVADDETLGSHGCGHIDRRVVAAEPGKAIT